MVNYYRILNLHSKATEEQISEAYRSILSSGRLHIDEALIHTAYAHLGTQTARKRYDDYLITQSSRVDRPNESSPAPATTHQTARTGPAPVARVHTSPLSSTKTRTSHTATARPAIVARRRSPPHPVIRPSLRSRAPASAPKTASPIGKSTLSDVAQRARLKQLDERMAQLQYRRDRIERRLRDSANGTPQASPADASRQQNIRSEKDSESLFISEEDKTEEKKTKERDKKNDDGIGEKKDYGPRTTLSDALQSIANSQRSLGKEDIPARFQHV
ncbi:MAG: hypothetical protein Q9220_005292 [cf. Caloplaca sp. 1 TL-2023]